MEARLSVWKEATRYMYRLFIVEDEEIIRDGLCMRVPWEKLGFSVAGQAADGAEALRLLNGEIEADAVLTDIRMEGMDGLQLLKALRDCGRTLPVVLLSGYDQFEFDVPTQAAGDVYARYQVRVEEMRQSVRIIQQALDKLPYGPIRSNNRKYVPPPRAELGVSMEALIHHFKLWTEGFSAPKGSVYAATESPRGELGVFLESDGGPKPFRVHYHTPTFANLQIMPILTRGHFVADVVAIIGSIDVVLGDADR